MIEPPSKNPSLQDAAEWVIRALKDEDFPILFCGRAALDYQGEYTGSVDIDVLIGTDFRGALSVLDAYVDRGDLFPAGAVPGAAVVEYLVSGLKPVDVMNASSIHPDVFDRLRRNASRPIRMGSAGTVHLVTHEGYFVLAIMIGLRGFARDKKDPMLKVREAWALFGQRTDRAKVNRLLKRLGAKTTLEETLQPPTSDTR